MSILIKDMDMPKSCQDCELAKHFDGYYENDCPFNAFSFYDCPLVEVPVPHGRLIDADEVCYQLEKQATIDGQPRAIRRARRIVADAPTIIEAEEGVESNG